jgi:CubicO group peptidase (beta-lactamase class C family)
LTHTAGFSGNDPGGLDDDAKLRVTLAEYGALVDKEPLSYQPGEQVRYSGPGFATLGRIVEMVAGMSLEAYARKVMFGPLGMRDTAFFAPAAWRPRLASVYTLEAGKLSTIQPNPYREGARFANPAGGLYSTAADMATLLGCINEGGVWKGCRFLSPAAIEAMTSVQTGSLLVDNSEAQGFGLGFAVVKSPVGSTTLRPVGSYGHTGAFGTGFWADRRRGIVAVFMGQGFDNVNEARKTFDTMVNAAFVGR